MNWYPWLNQPYRQVIGQHQENRAHHALLIQAMAGMGDEALVWGRKRAGRRRRSVHAGNCDGACRRAR